MPEVFNIAGSIGVVLFLIAYGGLQLGLLRGASYAYTIINILAAGLVLIALFDQLDLPILLFQIAWIILSFIGLARLWVLNATSRLNPEESAFRAAKFPQMPAPAARRFFDAGHWIDAPAGLTLTIAGVPTSSLYYLAKGSAEVTLNNHVVGTCQPESFVGEMSAFEEGPASATVIVQDDARLFRIDTPSLNAVCRQDSDIKVSLVKALSSDTRMKLQSANTKIAGDDTPPPEEKADGA